MSLRPRLGTYAAATGPELLIARGPADGAQLLLVQSLFEEAIFTRTFASDLCRNVAAAGIGTWLFDLPGQGDSPIPLEAIRLADWIAATRAAAAHVAAATGTAPHLLTIRGSALLVRDSPPLTRLAPCDGPALLRPLRRAGAFGDSAGLAGWPVSDALAADLAAATLPADPATDLAWPQGTPPWRRAEPAGDPAAAAHLAELLIAACAAR